MRKTIHFLSLLTAALCCLIACEKEDGQLDNNDPEHALTPEQQFWAVVGQLVDAKDITPDYKGKTFTPIIGTEVEPGVRVVGVNSLEAAVSRYNTLTKANIDTTKMTHTYKSKEVGTLTWNKNTDNKAWATVDVNISAVPSLQKIIYRSAQQGDVNGSVDGSAYYRFGDVIERIDNGRIEYWICVRPAFGPEDKGKSHWVTVSPLPEENIWPYYEDHKPFTASNGFEYGLPYNIRDDAEWYQDLAEMLFAICYPTEWVSNIGSYSSTNMFGSPKGLPIFNDFHCTNIKYHNANFWKNVQQQWKTKGLVQKIFGISYDQLAEAVKQPTGNQPAGDGLRFLYNGYSWWTKTSNKAQLWQIHYSNQGTKDVQKNMHYALPTKPSAQLVTPNNKTESDKNFPMNVHTLTENKPYLQEPRFFGDNAPRWIIRYAEGVELATNGKFSPQIALAGFDEDHEIYRYYRDVVKNKNLSENPEETTEVAQTEGAYAGKAGFFYPGVVIKEQDGTPWICISGWINEPSEAVTKDKKARFFTTKFVKGSMDNGIVAIQEDLPKENDAATLAFLLMSAANAQSNAGGDRVASAAEEYLDLNLRDYWVERDTTWKYNDQIILEGKIKTMSIIYEPLGGRTPGTQPYMRLVWDGTHVGRGNGYSSLPKQLQYSGVDYYTKYNNDSANLNGADVMDLSHLFTCNDYITSHGPIPADKWSRAKRSDTQQRDGAYTADNRIYNTSYVDVREFWYSKKNNAYHEPVLILKYMELDDPSRLFQGTYNGKAFTLVSNPVTNDFNSFYSHISTAMAIGFSANTAANTWCTKNNQPYAIDLYSYNKYATQ